MKRETNRPVNIDWPCRTKRRILTTIWRNDVKERDYLERNSRINARDKVFYWVGKENSRSLLAFLLQPTALLTSGKRWKQQSTKTHRYWICRNKPGVANCPCNENEKSMRVCGGYLTLNAATAQDRILFEDWVNGMTLQSPRGRFHCWTSIVATGVLNWTQSLQIRRLCVMHIKLWRYTRMVLGWKMPQQHSKELRTLYWQQSNSSPPWCAWPVSSFPDKRQRASLFC